MAEAIARDEVLSGMAIVATAVAVVRNVLAIEAAEVETIATGAARAIVDAAEAEVMGKM